MGTIKLTSYGSSLREPVNINGFVLTSVYYQADDIYSLDVISDLTYSDLYFEETDCQGNVYPDGSGRIRVKDDSESEYVAYSMLFYTNYEGTKKIVAVLTSDQHDYVISKNSDAINKFINLDLSVFQYGVSFSSYVSGSRVATQNSDGLLHIDDPNTSIDDSYSVYSKAQVDGLISNFVESSDIPTNISAFNNDAGYISQIKTINNQSLVGTGDITITTGGDYATYIGNSAENYVAYSNNVTRGKALLPYADAADSAGYVDLGRPTNRWRNAYINGGIFLYDNSSYISASANLLRLHARTGSNSATSVTADIVNTRFHVYSYTGQSADYTMHNLITARSSGISLYDNYVKITSTETTFNKDIDLVLAKDTNTYIYSDIQFDYYELSIYPRNNNNGVLELYIHFASYESWSKSIPLSELDSITPIGELIYTGDSNYTINQTSVTTSLKNILEQGDQEPSMTGLYIEGNVNSPTSLGVFFGIYNQYSDNDLLFVIPLSELSLSNFDVGGTDIVIFNSDSTYSISNGYNCSLAISWKISIQDYIERSFGDVCTLSTDQYITGNKTFYSNVYIPTSDTTNLYVTGYTDGAGIRFGDNSTSVSYPMIVGETMSSTRCDLRQNYYVNNTLAGTIQTQCDSDGNLLTTSGLGRSSSTTGKWSLGTPDYRLNAVYADNFQGDLSGNATTATTATTAINAINADSATSADTATTATTAIYSQYIKYSTSTNYPMYASSSTVLRPTVNSSVDIGTSSYKYKNVYADFYNGFPIIPFGTCDSDASADKVVTLSPAPPSLTTGMIICVQFNSTNTKSSPTLNVNGLGAKVMWRTSSDQIGTNIATSWPAGSRVLFRYSGSTWSMISKVDYQTSTASNTNIIPSTDNTYNIGSTDYKWKNLYITGGHSTRHIVIDNNSGEPTIRPDRTNYGYLGSSTYHWYDAYINNVYVGQNEVPLPPISGRTNTQLGSIQFLRVAIPANTTTGIKNAGSALSSSTYTLMLVTASTGATYLSFRNNTAPSGTWTTLTDMYFYNSTTSTVYTYVLAYKSA